MPVKRRLSKRRVGVRIDENIVMHFIRGDAVDADQDQLRELWAQVRDDVLPAFTAKLPGMRPHAWWLFDAPDNRGDETQREYLSRRKLLSHAEQTALASGMTIPESRVWLRVADDNDDAKRLNDLIRWEENLAAQIAALA